MLGREEVESAAFQGGARWHSSEPAGGSPQAYCRYLKVGMEGLRPLG